ncbi:MULTISPECIES: DUF3152 domain-containing protein [unclassified Streptomyces]|uniref:DUF3152 domain-containing protein n=1 Tax=unclassified Streptomyces TaxID=2593676 RepID=UPI002E13E3D4|nr:DUF3152 domain-containing protein [Streptomyces sp. NBC_01197]WSS51248.1 DUF3152 domain-containing protein [Streptomyces sp. NBC_01180]
MHSARQRQSAPPTASTASAHRVGRRRRTSHRRGHPRRRGRSLLVGALVAVGLLVPATYFLGGGRSDASSSAPRPPSTHVARTPAPTAPPPKPTPSPTPPPSPSHTPSHHGTEVPSKGSGTFVTAQAGGATVGSGSHPLRYVVEIETGLDTSASQAAKEIAGILAAPRGWTHDPDYAFQLVSAGAPHDLTVKIATPGTADSLCWAGIHQDTGGEYNCEVPGGVVVNLRRWVKGSPTFDGPIHDYRALIINHEMGHFLGYSHVTCAGAGRLAPVMMQQIKGLHGCVANAWPYDKNGDLVTGPPA